MWMGVKAAVSYDEVTKAAFAPFAKFGDSVGNLVKNIPSYLPTPHPAVAPFMPSTWSAAGGGINKDVIDTKNNKERTTLANIVGSDGTRAMDLVTDGLKNNSKSLDDFSNALNSQSEGDKNSEPIEANIKTALTVALEKMSPEDKRKFQSLHDKLQADTSRKEMIQTIENSGFTTTDSSTNNLLNAIKSR